jgi:8-oxo-dGTP diphosphatase
MKHHEVVAAIIVNGSEILCLQRGPSKYDYIAHKYEFPGGKVEADETREEALIREIKEELELDIQVQEHFLTCSSILPINGCPRINCRYWIGRPPISLSFLS